MDIPATSLARLIDHSALKPETTDSQIRQYCREAHHYGFAAVCVMPYYVPLAVYALDELGNTGTTAVCTTIGFPGGAHQSIVKVAEARKAVHDGATELDMVINIGALISGHHRVVAADIMGVAGAAHEAGALLKVIIETCLLDDDQKKFACELAVRSGADFVKTSTGFAGGGATVADVQLMRAVVGPGIGVKASGGIRNRETAVAMIEAGAGRIGTSNGVGIIGVG